MKRWPSSGDSFRDARPARGAAAAVEQCVSVYKPEQFRECVSQPVGFAQPVVKFIAFGESVIVDESQRLAVLERVHFGESQRESIVLHESIVQCQPFDLSFTISVEQCQSQPVSV